jgi:hypothetical protein
MACSLIDTSRLRSADALELALVSQIGFKLREYAEHVEDSGAGVDRLLGRFSTPRLWT